LKSGKTQEFLKKNNIKNVQTFKISPNFEEYAAVENLNIFNTSSSLNQKFENKISQYEIFENTGVNFPKTLSGKLSEFSYDELKKKIGKEFIIQFGRGHTGSSTILITERLEFEKLQSDFPERTSKISEYIVTDFSYTINCVIASGKIFCGGLSFQITGVKELTVNSKATVGNDFAQRKGITNDIEQVILVQVKKIGEIMKKSGYQGMFGIDFLIKNKEVFVIEINARQTQSIPLTSKLQLMNNQIPLQLLHIAEFLGIEIDIDEDKYNKENIMPINASQIFLREVDEKAVIKGHIKPGIYRLQSDNSAVREIAKGNKNIIFLDEEKDKPLIYRKEGYNVSELIDSAGILILAKKEGTKVKRGDEIARIQMLSGATDQRLELHPWIVESFLAIRNYLK
jgi:glutathione synthase/RimK-type ligase-like ATP-grasp enzyme